MDGNLSAFTDHEQQLLVDVARQWPIGTRIMHHENGRTGVVVAASEYCADNRSLVSQNYVWHGSTFLSRSSLRSKLMCLVTIRWDRDQPYHGVGNQYPAKLVKI